MSSLGHLNFSMLSFPFSPSISKSINNCAIKKQKNTIHYTPRVIHDQDFSLVLEKLCETTLTAMINHQREDLGNESILKDLLVLEEHQELQEPLVIEELEDKR
jgi:hypothetical protein